MIAATDRGDLASAARPSSEYSAYQALNTSTFTGRPVTPETALALTAVYGAVSLLSNTCGTLPLETIDQRGGKRQLVEGGRLAPMLRHQPNTDMNAASYWTLVFAHLLLRGNAYSAKLRDASGQVNELYPLLPSQVYPFRGPDGQKLFRVTAYDGGNSVDRVFTARDILHIAGPSFDQGLMGASPIAIMRNRLGVGLAQSEFQARFYQQGAALKGVLSSPQTLTPEAAATIKQQWRLAHSGMENAHEIAVIHSGAQFQNVSVSPEDAQFIETMKWSATEVATAFNIPASRLNAEGASLTYANSAQDDLSFAKSAVLPRLAFVEGALNADPDLFGFTSPWVPKFNIDGLLRADIKTRYETYQIGKAGKWLSTNDIRKSEDMPPVEGGDEYGDGGGVGMSPAESVGLASQRLGLAAKYGIVSAEEARQILDRPELSGPPPAPDPDFKPTAPQE